MINTAEYLKERNRLLRNIETLTEAELDKHCIKYGLTILTNRKCMWAGLHKARIEICNNQFSEIITEEMVEQSKKWLKDNGFNEKMC